MDYGGTIPKGGASGENGDGIGSDEHQGGTSSIDRSSDGASDESGDGADTIDPEGGTSSIDKSGSESGDGRGIVDSDQGGVDDGSSKDDFGKSGGCSGDDNVSAVGSDDDHNADDSDYSCFGVEISKETSTEKI
ncbi:hypothetical protein DVH05_024433 [Phytophthora capsici]|nr:hypothetical protein DVH05_024433 [Phytophthora capsici]